MAEFILGNPVRKLARRYPGLQRALWRADYGMVWTLVKLFSLVPVDAASRLGERVGRWIGPRLKKKSAIYRENFRIAFPDKSDAEIDRLVVDAWGCAGRVLAEYPHLDKILSDEGRLEIVVLDPESLTAGRPCVVTTAHLCNWEVVCSAMAKLSMPNSSLYSPPTNPYLDRMLADSRRALNCELIPRDNSARPLMRALRQGRTAGLVVDRRIDDGKPVEFFGHDKFSSLMPGKLALKHELDLVPVQVERIRDARYRVTFHPPVKPGNPKAGETAQAIDMMQQVHRHFEDWIRLNPADWFCSKRLWENEKSRSAANLPRHKTGIDSYAA